MGPSRRSSPALRCSYRIGGAFKSVKQHAPRSAAPPENMPSGAAGGRNQFAAPISDPPRPFPFAWAGVCDAQRPLGSLQLGLVIQNLPPLHMHAHTATHTKGPVPFFLPPPQVLCQRETCFTRVPLGHAIAGLAKFCTWGPSENSKGRQIPRTPHFP
jgi:hypothetical protein